MILLTTAVVLLALVVAVHLLFTFALVARVRQMSAHGGHGAGHAGGPQVPRPGTVVRPFAVTDTGGATITEADLDGPVQVGFFQVGCGPCRMLSDALAAAPPQARFVSVVQGDPDAPDATERLAGKLGALGRVAVVGVDDPVLTAFEVVAFPTLLHTHRGVVTASGIRLDDFAPATGVPAKAA